MFVPERFSAHLHEENQRVALVKPFCHKFTPALSLICTGIIKKKKRSLSIISIKARCQKWQLIYVKHQLTHVLLWNNTVCLSNKGKIWVIMFFFSCGYVTQVKRSRTRQDHPLNLFSCGGGGGISDNTETFITQFLKSDGSKNVHGRTRKKRRRSSRKRARASRDALFSHC